MKIIDIPQSGKRGLYVSQRSRYGLISRAYVIPANPRTPPQMSVRAILTRVTTGWRALTEAQRAAWVAAANFVQTSSRLGSGAMTGGQLYTKINCTLAQFGLPTVDAPPPRPQFPALAPQNLVITNTGGTITLKLTCPADPGDGTIVRASAPVSQGFLKWAQFRIIGTCPAADQGASDITALYTARYGVPPVGSKVFVRVNQFIDGWEDNAVTFAAIVPTAS